MAVTTNAFPLLPDPETALAAAPMAETFFEGFEEKSIAVGDSKVFVRMKGEGTPLLLLHGADDRVVLPLHSQLLQERMDSENGRVKKLELEGVDHFGIVLALSEPFAHLAPSLLPSIETFIQEQI